MTHPIWRDYLVTLPTDTDNALYRICKDTPDNPVYFGRAWKRPNTPEVQICINDIAADFFTNTIPRLPDAFDTDGLAVIPLYPVTLFVQVQNTDGTFTTVDTITFVRNYGYNPDIPDVTSVPIRNSWNRQLPYLLTINTHQRLYIKIYEGDAIIKTINFDTTQRLQNDYSTDFNSDYSKFGTLPPTSAVAIDLKRYQHATRVELINGDDVTRITIVDSCSNWALYYLNSFGGYDGYIIDGALAPSFGVERGVYNRDYINDNLSDTAVVNYRNDITRRAQVRTGWLSDSEARIMAANLFASPLVYLYNAYTSSLLPVRLTGTEYEVKSYALNGGQLVNYALDVEVTRRYTRR